MDWSDDDTRLFRDQGLWLADVDPPEKVWADGPFQKDKSSGVYETGGIDWRQATKLSSTNIIVFFGKFCLAERSLGSRV